MLRKIVSIHSEDRDVSHWKNSNEFEITLPESLSNIKSIQLCHAVFPDEIVFSKHYMNTMIRYKKTNNTDFSYITINDGAFRGDELANELRNAFIREGINDMRIIYENSKNKFSFLNINSPFNLDFNIPTNDFLTKMKDSDLSNNMEERDYFNKFKNIFVNKINWGLGYYFGFTDKINTYTSSNSKIPARSIVSSLDISDNRWISSGIKEESMYHVLQSEYPAKINGDNLVYLEIDPFNFIDEIDPNNANTNNTYNNQSSSCVNSAFSKILLQLNDIASSSQDFLSREHLFNPPLPRLTKVKFRFRYHDGRLVDFQNQEFSFSLRIDYQPISRR